MTPLYDSTFKVIPKLPYSFSYEFEDADRKKSKLQILDWEIGALLGVIPQSTMTVLLLSSGK